MATHLMRQILADLHLMLSEAIVLWYTASQMSLELEEKAKMQNCKAQKTVSGHQTSLQK